MLISCTSCGSEHFPGATFCPSCGNHLLQAHDPLVDRVLGKYKIERRVGDGGCSSVYQARHVDQGKSYAVKILLPQFSSNEEMVERFRREAQVLSELQHPNIVELYDSGWIPGLGFYLAMEWLDGETIKDYLIQQGPMEKEVVLYLFAQLLDALNTAHQQGIIHRDLKLENLMLVRGGFGRTLLKVLDFGIAHIRRDGQSRLTSTGLMVGTPRYMAPEQVRGHNHAINNRTDLYACGLMLLEMLTGQPAFLKETVQQLLYSQLEENPPLLQELYPAGQFGEKLEQVVRRATQKSPEDRFPSAFAFYEALEEAMRDQHIKLCGHITLQLSSLDHKPIPLPHLPLHSSDGIPSIANEGLYPVEEYVSSASPLHFPAIKTPEIFASPLKHAYHRRDPASMLSLPDLAFFSVPVTTEGATHSLQPVELSALQPIHFLPISSDPSTPTTSPWIDDRFDSPAPNLAQSGEKQEMRPAEFPQHIHASGDHFVAHPIPLKELSITPTSDTTQEATQREIQAIPDSNTDMIAVENNTIPTKDHAQTAPHLNGLAAPTLATTAAVHEIHAYPKPVEATIGFSSFSHDALVDPLPAPLPIVYKSFDSLEWQPASLHHISQRNWRLRLQTAGLILLWLLVAFGFIKLLWL